MNMGVAKPHKSQNIVLMVFPILVSGDGKMAQLMARRLPPEAIQGVKNMPMTEDLSLEHGILSRILMAMNNTIKAIDAGGRPNMNVIAMGCNMMKQLVDMRHMKFEEEYVYPLFDKGECSNFVNTLRDQHNEGRKFVARMESLSKAGSPGSAQMEELKRDFTMFHDMMLAHAAFEETILFPILEGAPSDDQMRNLKMLGVKQEESLLGPNATQKAFDMLSELEAAAGVTGLSNFTQKAL